MKVVGFSLALASAVSAFAPSRQVRHAKNVITFSTPEPMPEGAIPEGAEMVDEAPKEPARPSFSLETIPGALPPMGIFDPLGFGAKADEMTLKRYREAELTHGRVGMVAVVGFLVGEAVQDKTFLFNGEVKGPAITHIPQVNPIFWILLAGGIGYAETQRAKIGWVEPENVPYDNPGLLRDNYIPGDIGFDPLGLKPSDPEEFKTMQTKELQNGRLGMIAAAGFLAQELVNGKGILENLGL